MIYVKTNGKLFYLGLLAFITSLQPALAATNALTLTITAPEKLANLGEHEKPNPVYLQFTSNTGAPAIYSPAVYPGDTKPVELKITSTTPNGGQIQFVSSNTGAMQPMSFIYAFSGERLTCLINKNAKIQVYYSINTKLLDVQGIPADC